MSTRLDFYQKLNLSMSAPTFWKPRDSGLKEGQITRRKSHASCSHIRVGMWLVFTSLAMLHGGLALAELPPAIANVIVGGGDRHCSSFNGATAGQGCAADWTMILAQDPALSGLRLDDVSFDPVYVLPKFIYSLNAANLAKLRDSPATLLDAQRKAELVGALTKRLAEVGPAEHLDFMSLDSLRGASFPRFSVGLTAPELAILRACLVDPVPAFSRRREVRSLVFASNPYVRSNYALFVEAARRINGGVKPLIGVVTASADTHPFADADVNIFALETAGARVVYVPLGGGMRRALDRQDCSHVNLYYDHYANTRTSRSYFHGALTYPDFAEMQRQDCEKDGALLHKILAELNGLYFSGGDQARHLESFITRNDRGQYTRVSPQLDILRKRHAQGKLVVAGTSAGNHAQGGGQWMGKPVPMIGGGDSYEALRGGFLEGTGPVVGTAVPNGDEPKYPAVTYSRGGLGFFHYGLLDSHFSTRAREGRLVRLTQESGMDYGFGVDENTALVVYRPDAAGVTRFSVNGAAGVLIVDVRNAKTSGTDPGGYEIEGVRLHYLQAGDNASINKRGDLQVRLDKSRDVLPVAAAALGVYQKGVLDYGSSNFLNLTRAMGMAGAATGFGSTEGSLDSRSKQDQPYYSATLSRDTKTEFRGPSGVGGINNQVSYTQLLLKFAPCSGMCSAP